MPSYSPSHPFGAYVLVLGLPLPSVSFHSVIASYLHSYNSYTYIHYYRMHVSGIVNQRCAHSGQQWLALEPGDIPVLYQYDDILFTLVSISSLNFYIEKPEYRRIPAYCKIPIQISILVL